MMLAAINGITSTVAERVELPVRRNDLVGLAQHRATDPGDLPFGFL
jgi:hypothetical protein